MMVTSGEKVFQFGHKIINTPNLSEDVYIRALKMIKEWILPSSTFIKQKDLIKSLFSLLSNQNLLKHVLKVIHIY
jgi:hypothetical protein